MNNNSFVGQPLSLVETAILAKCMLEEAWKNCMESLAHRFVMQQISLTEKLMLEEMYTSFFYDAYYTPVKTERHIRILLVNTRRMLNMLRAMDENAWCDTISLNNYGWYQ